MTLFFSTDSLAQYSDQYKDYSYESVYPVNPYLLPAVFDGKFSDDFSIHLPDVIPPKKNILFPILEPQSIYLGATSKEVEQMRRMAYRQFIRNNILSVKYSKANFPKEVEKVKKIKPNIFTSLFEIESEVEKNDTSRPDRFVPKRKYWIMNGSSTLQFSQNFVSKNWYNGGVGNLNMVNIQNFTANYKKDKILFNNFVEWKFSFFTNPNDTIRKFRMGEDLFRTYSDFGVQVFNSRWSYSSNLEFKTQILRNYKENSYEYISSFLSPFQINVGILGFKYLIAKVSPKSKYKKYNLSIDLSPLAIQYTRIISNNIDPTRYGIENGRNSLLDKGSTLNAKVIMQFNRQVSFTSRLKYFTNYEKTIFETESELNMALNRFFSTRLYLYGRYDDSKKVTKDPNLGYFQLNELLSFGFKYKW
jgi:hypothetical protein